MKNQIRNLAAIIGIFTATVIISYAASSLIPTYAPGENPPSLDQAPLIYQMAGDVNPETFNNSGSSLMDIKQAVDNISVNAGSTVSTMAGSGNGMVMIIDGDLYVTGQGLYCSFGLPDGNYSGKLYKTLENVESVLPTEYGGNGSVHVYSYIATKTDGSVWASGNTAYYINGYSYPANCAWVRVDDLPRVE